ncbi:MAG: BREX system P-loop protein BrxC, partial [Phormidesmis sp. CAN_BIN36]|nr:BREX system P-loop protein BrxC [Phormidesmis sp. CAN_BIN36]
LYDQGLQRLNQDVNWQQLDPEQQHDIMVQQSLTAKSRPKIDVESPNDVLKTLSKVSLSMFKDRVGAMPGRFDKLGESAARLLAPETQFVQLPRRTLKTAAEIEDWMNEVKGQLTSALAKGPVSI